MSLTRILDYELLGFVYVLAAVVVFQLLTGRINLKGLIFAKDGSGQVSAARVQLLAITIATCIRYTGEVATATKPVLPDVDNTWLYLMGGSSGIYVARKAWTHLRRGNKIKLGG
jgi:hypothetical protein